MNIWLLITLMAIVTYLPRVLPLYIMRDLKIPNWLKKWLSLIPYAALGALIFPGILNAVPNQPLWGLFLGIFAFLLAWFSKNLIVIVLSTIILNIVILYFF